VKYNYKDIYAKIPHLFFFNFVLTLIFERRDDEFEAVGLRPPTISDVLERHKVGPRIDDAHCLLGVSTREVRLQKKRDLLICDVHESNAQGRGYVY
jgi:hypothetical protein